MANVEIRKSGAPWGLVSLILLVVIIGILWFSRPVSPTLRQISVNGECLGTVERDKTAVSLRATVLGKNAGDSMRSAQQIAAKITADAAAIGDTDLKMQTTRFDSFEKTEWNQSAGRAETVGFETTITTEFSSKNRETIEKILTGVTGYQNVFVENLRMFTSAAAMKPALENCVSDAVRDARTRAESIAAADNMKVGKLLNISYSQNSRDNGGYQPMFRMAAPAAMAETMGGGASLQSRDSDFNVTVSASFELR